MSEPCTREQAAALDARDELAGFRDLFVEGEPEAIYLDGNSLGRPPKATAQRLADLVAGPWARDLVQSWEHWIDQPSAVGDLLATELLGAHPGEVAVSDCTTVNLYKLAAAAIAARPGRRVLVTAADEFPTDRYLLQGLAADHGLTVRQVPADLDLGPSPEDVIAALDSDVALLLLSHVGYRSGALADLPRLTEAAHAVGALVLWDLSHAVGSVPIDLAAGNVDLAAGCTYKYLNAGPGSPAFLYVRRDLQSQLVQPIWGWFGTRHQFAMGEDYDPEPDVRRFLTASPAILGLAAIEEGARLLGQAGVGRLRAKGVALTELALQLHDAWLEPLGFALASPRDPARRGSHLTLRHLDAYAICRALIVEANVVGDYRTPDRLRLGPAPIYTRFVDVWDAFDRIRTLVTAGGYERYAHERRRVT
ncbi:MAG: kynureninase [Sporichthyaceae bacterium]